MPLNDGVLAGAEEKVKEDGRGAARPQQLGGHISEGGQGTGPAVFASALPHHAPHHPPRSSKEQLQQALVVGVLTEEKYNITTQQLGSHVGEGGQGAGPAVLAPTLAHHDPHHPPRAGSEQLEQALVVGFLTEEMYNITTQQLGSHVGEGGQGLGPAVLAPPLPHHAPHHPTRSG